LDEKRRGGRDEACLDVEESASDSDDSDSNSSPASAAALSPTLPRTLVGGSTFSSAAGRSGHGGVEMEVVADLETQMR